MKRLSLYVPGFAGHYPAYLGHLLQALSNADQHITVFGPDGLMMSDEPLLQVLHQNNLQIEFQPLPSELKQRLVGRKNILQGSLNEWAALERHVVKNKADILFHFYLDSILFPLSLGKRFPVDLAGILFRTDFYYRRPRELAVEPWLRYFRQRLKGFWLKRALKNSALTHALVLDPNASRILSKTANGDKISFLPEPVWQGTVGPEDVFKLHSSLRIAESRTKFLLFGMLDERKGVVELMDAVASLDDQFLKGMAIIFAGPESKRVSIMLDERLPELHKRGLQTVRIDRFILESEIAGYFESSDVILLLYKNHIGMSNVLVRAAKAEKPVIASDYGLIGRLTEEFELGITVDVTSLDQIKRAFMMDWRQSMRGEKRARRSEFADLHSPERYCEVILDALQLPKIAQKPESDLKI